jgi:hypothetical protein
VPISLSISHEDRRVVAVVETPVTLVEGMITLGKMFAAGAYPYAKIIDLTYAPLTQGAKGIRQISDRVAQFGRGRKPGPLAFVVRSELALDLIELFERQINVNRPMKVFADRQSAHAWLDSLSIPAKAEAVG